MLTEAQFEILKTVYLCPEQTLTQRALAAQTDMSLGKVNQTVSALTEAGLLAGGRVTDAGEEALAPYRVKNAVIMAAGMSTRFAPLSYEKPKALLRVKGELLIEREIRQLQEAGIRDITLVVGYMKEKMFYLAEKFGVDIVVNPDYYRYNNTSTLMLVADRLENTYICSSDDYFAENPFEPFVYRAYYAAVYAEGETEEYCLKCNRRGRITGVTVGGHDAWCMLGHVYFDRAFSSKFVQILRAEYNQQVTREHLWEDLYIRYIGELEMYIRRYDAEKIKEFDSLDELRAFDDKYVGDSGSAIFRNICGVLGCAENEIHDIHPIKTGMTNLSFRFTCRGEKYVYRHPGVGTDAYINRRSEASSMEAARRLGLDDTYIYMDEAEGWKLSRYIEDARTLDYHDEQQVTQALAMLRRLHESGEQTAYPFDAWGEIQGFEESLRRFNRADFEDMQQMRDGIARLRAHLEADGTPVRLCHCDSYAPNFLLDRADKMYLIDWEYSGMSDPAWDIGTFIACADYTMDEADGIIQRYMGREPSREELRHHLGYVAVASFYWFLWALYQDCVGKSVGSYLYIWYRYTKSYSARALALYEDGQSEKETNA